MIDKLMYGTGYASEIIRIRARNLKNVIASSKVLNKQKQYITEGSKAAQVAFLTSKIMRCTKGDISKLAESVRYIKNTLNHLHFSEDVFREANRNVIEEYSSSEEVLMENPAL